MILVCGILLVGGNSTIRLEDGLEYPWGCFRDELKIWSSSLSKPSFQWMGLVKKHVNENSKNDLEKENKFHFENDDFELMKIKSFWDFFSGTDKETWVSCFYQSWYLKWIDGSRHWLAKAWSNAEVVECCEKFCLEARAANFSRADAVQIAQQGSPHHSPELPKLLKQHLRWWKKAHHSCRLFAVFLNPLSASLSY